MIFLKNNPLLLGAKARLSLSLYISLLLWATLCLGCKEYEQPQAPNPTPEASNIAIGELRRLAEESGQSIIIEEDIVVGGYVNSSDKSGNFYKSFTIEDHTGGIEIMAGLYDLHNIYPEGYYIALRLRGCALSLSRGHLCVGREAERGSSFDLDYFDSRIILDKYVKRYEIKREIAPMALHINELSPEKCGRLVSIGSLHSTTANHLMGWNVNTEGCWSGYNFFADDLGREIGVYTSEYATYADHALPQGRVALKGILELEEIDGKEYYLIKMRDEKDCTPHN